MSNPPDTSRKVSGLHDFGEPDLFGMVLVPESSDVADALYSGQFLSWEARGVLAYMVTHPNEVITLKRLGELSGKKCGRDRATGILNELMKAGLACASDGKGLIHKKMKIPEGLRQQVLERDGYRCVRCETIKRLSVDHVIPERKGGPTTLENLQTLCKPCNSEKGTKIQ